MDGVVQILGLYFLQESEQEIGPALFFLIDFISAYAPLLLERKVERIRKSMDAEKAYREVRTVFEGQNRSSVHFFFFTSIRRHFMNICSIVGRPSWLNRSAVLSHYSSMNQSCSYLVFTWRTYAGYCIVSHVFSHVHDFTYVFSVLLTTIPSMFQGVYQQPAGIAGLHYIALGIGLLGASQISARTMDKIYVHLKSKNGGVGKPEFRLRSSLFLWILSVNLVYHQLLCLSERCYFR